MTEYSLVMKFLDGSDSFCHGYECGLLDVHMSHGDLIETQAVHHVNKEQIQMIANRYNYAIEWQDTDFEEWVFLTARPCGGVEDRRKGFMAIEGGLA